MNKIKKSDVKKIIREELFKALKEDSGEGYVELIIQDPNFEEGLKLIQQAWTDWLTGPATETHMIQKAKRDLGEYMFKTILRWK